MSFYFLCKREKLIKALDKLGLNLKEGAKHTKAECIHNGQKTTIPRHTEIYPEIVDKICKFLLQKNFKEEKIMELLK